MFDTLISGGQLLDGSGGQAFVADIGIRDGRILVIGDLAAAGTANRIDAAGLCVAPGFIDIHTHADFTLLVDGRADSQVCQGVTTEVIGQCGFSCAPRRAGAGGQGLIGYAELGLAMDWTSFGQYLDRLEQARPAVNVAAFVGHGAIHRAIKGDASSASTADEQAAMLRLTEEAFDDGAIGLSTGLEYWPGNTVPQAEIAALVAVAARRGGLYATHVRNRDVYYNLGFSEAIATARHAGARLQISHIQPKFGAPAQAMQHTLGNYVRERSVLSLADAVSRITSQAAERLGLVDRGRLRARAWADIVVFDPATVHDRSSFLLPRQHPAGIAHVLVNGVAVVQDGQRNDAQPGQVLRG